MLTSLQNIVLNEGLNDNGMYDILHVFVKFLGTQHCDKNMFMHYTCFCQKFCRQYITDNRNYGMYDILHVFVKILPSMKGCIIL